MPRCDIGLSPLSTSIVRIRLILTMAALLTLCLGSSVATAQSSTGFPPFGSFQISGIDSVNENNLNVHIRIPLFHKAGRGFPVNFQMQYDSSDWTTVFNSVTGKQQWSYAGGWAQWGVASSIGTLSKGPGTPFQICPTQKLYFPTYTDSAGTVHPFGSYIYPTGQCGGQNNATLPATDGSGYVLVMTNGNIVAYSHSGDTILTSSQITDPNGNSLSLTSNGIGVIDTFGMTALTGQYTSINNTTATYTDSYTGPDDKTAEPIVVTFTQLQIASNFGCVNSQLVTEYGPTGWFVPSGILLPDGTSYSFKYEPTPGNNNATTGRISEIDLPTGGSIKYSYGYWSGTNSMCADGNPASLTRTTSDGAEWQYTRNSTGNGTTVIDPTTKNQTFYNFSDASTGFETQRVVNQGSSSPLQTVVTCYNANFSNCASAVIAGTTIIKQTDVYTTPASGQAALSETVYNANGLVTLHNDFGYGINTGAAPTGTPLKSTIISYASLGNYINDRQSCIQTTAGSPPSSCGTVTSNTISLTNNTYDSAGNLKQSSNWVTGSTFLNRNFTYYSNGLLHTATDANSNLTTYTAQGCGPNNVSAFPSAATSGGLTTTTTWDCYGGVPTQISDANTNPTKYGYDLFWRLTSTTDPLNNVTYTTYTPATSTTSATVENYLNFPVSSPTSTIDTLYTLDGLGRVIESEKRTAPNATTFDDAIQYTYGWNPSGAVTGPFTTQTPPSGAAITTQMDALGRTASVVDGNTGSTSLTYPQNDVLSVLGPPPSNENAKQVQTEYDALGRPTSTCAISNTVSGSTPCGQKSGTYNGILTVTSYGSSSNGQQWMRSTRGAQTRTRTVDAMGRLVATGTPEGGTSLYYYDTAGCYGTNYPGHLTAASVANGNSYCYAYDTLGRLTLAYGLASSGATLCRQFFYDNSKGATGTIPSGITIANPYGRMVEAETANCSSLSTPITDEWFSYDAAGNTTDIWEFTPHSTLYYHSKATFGGNGIVTSLQLVSPSLYTMNYTLDGEGRWNTMAQGSSSIVTGPKSPTPMYNSAGQPIEVDLTGSDKDLYTYDPNTGNMKTYEFQVGGVNETGLLTWNSNYTLQQLKITDGFNSGGSQTCASSYDDLARLTVFDCGSGKWGQDFVYDQYDNLAQTIIPPDRTGSTWNPGYSVSPSNNHVIGATYDGSGNMTNDGVMNVYGYDQFNDLVWTAGSGTPVCGTSGKCITYDAFGRMVEKSNGGAWSEIWYTQIPGSQITMSGTTASYGYWPSPGRGTFVAGGTNMFLHQDWLGNDRIVSSVSAHTVSADRAYAPYGEQYNSFGSTNPIYGMFAGMTGDFDPGVLFDTPNRELAQYQGRWISPDPAGTGWNPYAYVNGNPLSYVDPSGLACYPIERLLFGSCGFSNLGVDFGANWDEFDTLSIILGQSQTTVVTSKIEGEPVGGTLTYYPGDLSLLNLGGNSSVSWAWNFTKSFFTFAGGPGNVPTCAGQALRHIGNTLNPFTPSVSTAAEVAAPVAQAAAISQGIAQTQVGIDAYIATRGLTVPLRSSIVRAMAAEGAEGAVAAGARANLAVQTLAVDYAAINSTITTAGEARNGQCAAVFPIF